MLRTYALAPETIRRFLGRTFWRFQGIALLSFLGLGLYLALLGPRPVNWDAAGPMVAIIALTYFVIIFYNYRQQLRLFYSMRYEIDDNSITYRQLKQAPLHIPRANITHVKERRDGLYVETSIPGTSLFIPNGLAREGDTDFSTTLGAWADIEPAPPRRIAVIWAWVAAMVLSFLILVFANNLWISLVLGIILILFGFFADRRLQHTTDLPPATIRSYSMALGWLVFVLIMKSCLLGFTVLAQASR